MTGLDAQLSAARDHVQTLTVALTLFDDTDLLTLPGSPNLQPSVSGSRTPPAPWRGDRPLAGHIMAALRQCHDAAVVLLDFDDLDPEPWEEPPAPPDRHAPALDGPDHTPGTDAPTTVPALRWCIHHLHALDQALATVQTMHEADQLDWHGRITALQAADLLLEPDRTGNDRRLTHPSWATYARRARGQCVDCHQQAQPGRPRCASCAAQGSPCVGIPGTPCDRRVAERDGSRCARCRKRLSRMTHDEIRTRTRQADEELHAGDSPDGVLRSRTTPLTDPARTAVTGGFGTCSACGVRHDSDQGCAS